MFPGVLFLLFFRLTGAHTPAVIYRYPGYTGCTGVNGTVTFHAENGTQEMLIALSNLPANATGLIQIHTGLNCFDPLQIGTIYGPVTDPQQFAFQTNGNGTYNGALIYGNVTVDYLMGRSVLILLPDDNSNATGPRRIGCGTVGNSYVGSMSPYPGATAPIRGSVAVTGPLSAQDYSQPEHGATIIQLAYALSGLPPNSTGKAQVFSGNSCANQSQIGSLWGTNWTSNYTAGPNGNANGNADISWVSPSRGVQDYFNHVLVLFNASDSPIGCAVLQCPTGSVDEGQSMNMQHGRCMPAVSWVSSTLVVADLYSPQSKPLQVQVAGDAWLLQYAEVRSYPDCAPQGEPVNVNFYTDTPGMVNNVIPAPDFVPIPGSRQVVVFGDAQPLSVGRQDNYANVSFVQSTQPNTHDVAHLAVGVDTIIFHVAAPGFQKDQRIHFGSTARVGFPAGDTLSNTTVWVTNAATSAILWQRAYLFGKLSPNFVWFVYGWDPSAPDCTSRQKNCQNTPINVTKWPGIREDLGPGSIPPVYKGSALMCAPSLFIVLLLALFE